MTPARPLTFTVLAALLLLLGCHTAPSPKPLSNPDVMPSAPLYPPRPTVPPPPFKVFHQDASTFTLVTTDDASNDQIVALIWQLRDAAQTHTFDHLHISQKAVDNRKPIAWFHIYRGSKCAAEKYTSAALPCGASYHAAGEFTFGGYKSHNAQDGLLLHDENHQTELWNPNQPSTPPT